MRAANVALSTWPGLIDHVVPVQTAQVDDVFDLLAAQLAHRYAGQVFEERFRRGPRGDDERRRRVLLVKALQHRDGIARGQRVVKPVEDAQQSAAF